MRAVALTVLTVIWLHGAHCRHASYGEDDAFTVQNVKQLSSEQFWRDEAHMTLVKKLSQSQNRNVAKNVILFIADGMSVVTTTASRIYDGQMKGIIGEKHQLSFEKFPYVGLSKTYCVDKQVPDSACTATAYFCGVKANQYTTGVNANVKINDCEAARQDQNRLSSIAGWALDAGRAAGLVTTTRITHASPAGAYAHTSNREFESDFDVHRMQQSTEKCPDIAAQLIENDISKRMTVILGGGSSKFLPNCTAKASNDCGERLDGRNLIHEWLQSKPGQAKYITNRDQLQQFNADQLYETDYLLGMFSPGHMAYQLDKDDSQPSLVEMTKTAIKMLQKKHTGYFLFVEGGRIDHAHHETRAEKAMAETVQFAEAIQKAYEMTNPEETLIVVSADHGHTMTISGYPDIGNKITGLSTGVSDVDRLPYATLSYANGPSFKQLYQVLDNEVQRTDLRKLFAQGGKDLQYPSGVPLADETHGGGDVAIYASGPWAHLFSGVLEQSSIPTIMGFAACLGPGLHACHRQN